MKKLLLLRHAKSSWDFPDLADYDRPLNKRGTKNAPKMGKRLRKAGLYPDQIISSPAVRAITTARAVASAVHFPVEAIVENPAIYDATITELIHAIRHASDQHDLILVCGHNPSITQAANLLSGSSIDNVPTAGLVGIAFSEPRWQDITCGRLEFFDYPKNEQKVRYDFVTC